MEEQLKTVVHREGLLGHSFMQEEFIKTMMACCLDIEKLAARLARPLDISHLG